VNHLACICALCNEMYVGSGSCRLPLPRTVLIALCFALPARCNPSIHMCHIYLVYRRQGMDPVQAGCRCRCHDATHTRCAARLAYRVAAAAPHPPYAQVRTCVCECGWMDGWMQYTELARQSIENKAHVQTKANGVGVYVFDPPSCLEAQHRVYGGLQPSPHNNCSAVYCMDGFCVGATPDVGAYAPVAMPQGAILLMRSVCI
jgi:hypothetical protein